MCGQYVDGRKRKEALEIAKLLFGRVLFSFCSLNERSLDCLLVRTNEFKTVHDIKTFSINYQYAVN